MLDRGLAASLRPRGRARGARRARRRRRRAARSAHAADVHDRPGQRTGLRRRDLGGARPRTARSACGCTSPTSARIVAPGSRVDREARRRATSVYVPGAVEPMLPAALSSEKCSLLPGEDRLTVSVELELAGARVVRAAFMRSLIRSDERLDYDRVDRIFAGAQAAEEPWATPLAVARRAARALGEERRKRGALEIAGAEPEFAFERSGQVRSVRVGEQTESHRLIEHLMIAANEQVAKLLAERARADALPGPRRAGSVECRAPRRTARVARGPDAAASRASVARRGGRARRADLAGGRPPRSRERSRQAGVRLAGPALAQAGLLLAAQHRPRRSALAALLPLHLADPPLPRPRLSPRAARCDRSGPDCSGAGRAG